ncbi:exodeoxyribonuclease VII large subunit [Haloarcula sp. S1CR25-12]|uniref:Exodeoxyribonuclease VII large subunit n=1 Tax=Haloarcula saliterrae TaxID=2950534 RepID=A0ABU2FE68_9EURY|nr:exodeoxyribonuclease VII large subunit [Haloarcula sp. S1CR25-12]MDS0260554.1 exodeoxyribonuclease VII large subunit [Haloarcula sp. S1CR25-12]
MGTEPETTDLDPLKERLDSEAVTFVNTLNGDIGSLIEATDELHFEYLVGDVSDHGVSSSNHTHFDLVHEDSTIHCVIFSFRHSTIDVDLEDGIQVAVKGDLSYYEDGGNISVIVEDIVRVGDGIYQQTYEENREILAEDGLLDPETKQELPERPRHIGIATSADSDAREDAVTSIQDRDPAVDITIHNTAVQGMDAMASMMEAISRLDDDATIDVIVLTRGGGSDKHLRVFNETPLCRVIHNTDTPVVVGVGHENDRSLADEVADMRVMTPTHVGEIVPEKAELEARCGELETRLETAYTKTVRTSLETNTERLDRAYTQRVTSQVDTLRQDLDHAFERVSTERLTELENRLESARTQYEQQRAYEQETKEQRRENRRLKIALVVLALLVLALALGIILSL